MICCPNLEHIKYLTLIDAHCGYNNLKLDENSLYLTTFACQLGRFRYMRLPFGYAAADDIFQRKINKKIKELPNVFRIADDILVVSYNENHDCEKCYTYAITGRAAIPKELYT